jgi:hypothetical protein
MEQWRLWKCKTCNSEMKINKIVREEEYNRIKKCYCGGELEYKKDLDQSEG